MAPIVNLLTFPIAPRADGRSLHCLLTAGIITLVGCWPAATPAQPLQIATPAPAPVSTPAPTAPGGMESAVQQMRQAAGSDDVEALAQAIQQVEALNPAHPSLSVYRSILQNKRSSGSTSGTVTGATASRVVTPRPTPRRTPEPTPAIAEEVKPPSPPPSSSASSESPWTKYLLPAGVALALLVLLALAAKMLRRNKASAAASATAATAAPPPPLPRWIYFSTPAKTTPLNKQSSRLPWMKNLSCRMLPSNLRLT